MIRVVIDTSVLIRYLIRPSRAIKEPVDTWWLGDRLCLVTSPELIAELENVLGREYIQVLIRPKEGQALLDAIHVKAEMLTPLGTIPSFTRDPKDDKFVACALVGDAEYLISVDKDILTLKTLEHIEMVTPDEFIGLARV